MATKFYLTALTAAYTPATIRGAWSDSAGAVTRALDTTKERGGATTTVARAETNASTTWGVLLYRGISGPLAAQTIGGTIDVRIVVNESNNDADMHWYVHAYVTTGDSDTPRGTILANYTEALGVNEWANSAAGKALNAAQALTGLAISAGDRLVVEIGYIARNSLTTSRTGTLAYGTTSAGDPVADVTVGATSGAGYILLSADLAEATIPGRLSQAPVEALVQASAPDARLSQVGVDVLSTVAAFGARFTQIAVEVLTPNIATAVQVSQIAVEALAGTESGFALTIDGVDVLDYLGLEAFSWEAAIGMRAKLRFTLKDRTGAYRPTLRQAVVATIDGVRIFGGVISTIDETDWGDYRGNWHTIECDSFEHYTETTFLNGIMLQDTLREKVTFLVDTFLASRGITLDPDMPIGPSLGATGHDFQYLNEIFDELVKLSTAADSQPWAWGIDPYGRLAFYVAGTRTGPRSLTADNDTINAIGWRQDFGGYANTVWVQYAQVDGAFTGAEHATDAAGVTLYGTFAVVLQFPEVTDAAKAQALADAALAERSALRKQITATTHTVGYQPGQVIPVDVSERDIDADCLITRVALSIDGKIIEDDAIYWRFELELVEGVIPGESWLAYFRGEQR